MSNIDSSYNLTKLFVTKDILIFNKEEQWSFIVKPKTVRDFFVDDNWNATYNLLTMSIKEVNKQIKINFSSSFEFVNVLIFQLGAFKEYMEMAKHFKNYLTQLIPSIDIDTKHHVINILTEQKKQLVVTEEIWEFIIYILRTTTGEKVEKPITFVDEAAKQFYLAQKAAEEKVARIKNQNKTQNSDGLISTLLMITYAFPSITIDYLFDQTLAQIQWLAEKAAGSVSYEVNAQAFAAGNTKRDFKLDFFLK